MVYCKKCKNNYLSLMGIHNQKIAQSRMSIPPKEVSKIRCTAGDLGRHKKNCSYIKKSIKAAGSPVTQYGHTSSVKKPASKSTKPSAQRYISEFLDKPLDTDETDKFHTLLIEFLVDGRLPFNLVERNSFHRLVAHLRPSALAVLPGRTKVRENLLVNHAKAAEASMDTAIQLSLSNGHWAGVLVDSFQNISKTHVDGVVLRTGNSTYPLDSKESGSSHDGLSIARDWEELLQELKEKYERFSYLCSDDAGQCARARRILALRWPHYVFIRCWAHQVNLMVMSLLKTTKLPRKLRLRPTPSTPRVQSGLCVFATRSETFMEPRCRQLS